MRRARRTVWAWHLCLLVFALGLAVAAVTLPGLIRSRSADADVVPTVTGLLPGAVRSEVADRPSTSAVTAAATSPGASTEPGRGAPTTSSPNLFVTKFTSDFDGTSVDGDVHLYQDVPGRYAAANVSQHDGSLVLAVTGRTGAGLWLGGPITYGRASVRVKVTEASGNGAAIMLWPFDDRPEEGELDFAEGDFDEPVHVYHHLLGSRHREHDSLETDADWREWHDLSVEWTPHQVRYLVDEVVVRTVTQNIPDTPHRLTLQLDNTSPDAAAGALLVDRYEISALR